MVDNGRRLAGFPPVCCTEEELEGDKEAEDGETSVYGPTSSIKVTLESGVGVNVYSGKRTADESVSPIYENRGGASAEL